MTQFTSREGCYRGALKSLVQVEFYCHWKQKDHKPKKSTQRQSNPPPKQKSPRTLSAVLCNQSDSVMQGGEESKSERTVNKSWEGRECHPVCWVVVGFCCVSFNRVLLIANMKKLVSGFRQIVLR